MALNPFQLIRKKQACLGVALEEGNIHMMEFRSSKGQLIAGVKGETKLPSGCFLPSGEIAQPEAVAEALEQLLSSYAPGCRNVVTAIQGESVIIRQFQIPAIPDEELGSAIRWEAENYLPLPMDQLEMDFAKVGELKGEGPPQYSILIVAAPKELVRQYYDIFSRCGLNLIAVEAEPVVITRLPLIARGNDTALDSVVLVDIHDQCSNIVVLSRSSLDFSRVIPVGIGGSLQNDEQQKGQIWQQVQAVAGEIGRSVNYYRTHSKGVMADRIFLTGEGSCASGLAESISERTGLTTEVLDIVIGTVAGKETLEPCYSTAAGLALREVFRR